MAWWRSQKERRIRESELETELRFHIDRRTADMIAGGIAPEQARRDANLEFGGREQIKEELRDVYRVATIENAFANLRSGVRLMRKSPSFSLTVILTLALGIGANSAVFSAINAILLRPLPFPNSDRLMLLRQVDRKAKTPATFVAPVRLQDWNRLNATFEGISGWYTQDISELSGTLPEKVTEALVAPRFLQVWGVSPALGRDFSPQEERFGGPNAVLISDRFWRQRFQADPKIAGKSIRLDGYAYTVIGVMPASFLFPDREVDIWRADAPDAPWAQSRESTWFTVVGRLRSGISANQARADLAVVQTQLGKRFPKTDANLSVEVQPLKETVVGHSRSSLWVLFGSVSLLLLIACTNIAALLLARTSEREREIAVRFSFGASRVSIVVQLLTECFVLAFAGSVLGLIAAAIGARGLASLAKTLPRAEEIALDWRIVLHTLACAVATTLLCGLFPAMRATRRTIASELAHTSRTQVSTRNPAQWLLAGVQVALAVILLTGAGLLLRTFAELARVSPGFETNHVLTFRISANWGETTDMKALTQRINRTLDSLRSVPGVREAATSATLPGILSDSRTEVKIVEEISDNRKMFADSRFVSNGYFATMQIPLQEGAGCGESLRYFEGVVVNRSFANSYLNGSRGVGRHLQLVSNQFLAEPAVIRGIVADAREQGLSREPAPTVYWCVSAPDPSPNFLVRTQGDPSSMSETLRRRIQAIEPARSVFNLSPLDEHLSDSFAETRLRTILLTLFALTAVSLACIGLYGTLSYFVAVRKREVGLRLALGARRRQIVLQFLWKGIAVTMAGCVAGLFLAAASTRVLSGMLYGVSAIDPRTFGSVVSLVLFVAAIGSLLPSLRAAKVEPMEVLRDE